MTKSVRIVLAVVVGVVVGSIVNMALIMVSGKVIPPPGGADVTTTEGLRSSLHLFQPKHFVFPFLAHSLGTLVGSLVAAAIAPSSYAVAAYSVGVVFLLGGVANVFMLPAPAWYIAVDLVLAYLPAAWLSCWLFKRWQANRNRGGF